MNESVPEKHSAEEPKKKQKKKKPHRGLRIIAIILAVILFLEGAYCIFIFSDIGFIKDLREYYIHTALETNSHDWLVSAFMPAYIYEYNSLRRDAYRLSQEGDNSSQKDRFTQSTTESTLPAQSTAPSSTQIDIDINANAQEEAFYDLFWELNRTSFEEYVDKHPSVLDDGWDEILINESGISDDGTSIYTTMGEQVLAIDVPNKILLVRVSGTGYIGILAICKDPAQLRVEASVAIGRYGQTIGDLVDDSDGVIGITGSGFYDPGGNGTGGVLAGYTMCEGESYGEHYGGYGYKRIELTDKNKMYIVDAGDPVEDDVTDAVEFSPALIIDGEVMINDDGDESWLSINPRACIGQTERDEYLLLVIEGRQLGRSIGADLSVCATIMKRYGGYTALNLDGGTSAIMYYRGEYVTRCSNRKIASRSLPNAWVYGGYDE